MSELAELEEFPDNYSCCCGFMHVKTGVKAIIGVGLVILGLSIYGAIATGVPLGPAIGNITIGALAMLCLIAAMVTEKKGFLVPYLIMQAARVILQIALLIGMIVYINTHDDPRATVKEVVMFAAGIPFPIWYLSIVYGYYKYLKNKTDNDYDNFA